MNIRPINEYDRNGWFVGRMRNPFVPVSLIVMHSTAGNSLSGAVSTLRTKKLGYHYLIDKDGTVWKGAPLSRNLGHAGNSYGPREQAKGVSRKQDSKSKFVANCSVNGYSIGISFVHINDGDTVITRAQWDAAVELVRHIRQVMPQIQHVTTHAIVSPRRKTDPRPFDLNLFAEQTGVAAWRYSA